MSELSFLIELLLNHRLQKGTKDAIAARIKEVESGPASFARAIPNRSVASGPLQSPSTQAILDRNPDLALSVAPVPAIENIAQTPATVAAINSRNQAINEALSGKINKETGRPRKF